MEIEERWKKLPICVKGGVILQLFLLIQIILILLVGLYNIFKPCGGALCGIRLMINIFLPNLVMARYFGTFVSNNVLAITLLMLILTAGIYFLIGTAIGWLVGKIGKR